MSGSLLLVKRVTCLVCHLLPVMRVGQETDSSSGGKAMRSVGSLCTQEGKGPWHWVCSVLFAVMPPHDL